MCVSYTNITGNVKSKHRQYDLWHSQVFSTGGQGEGAERPSGGMVGEFFCTLLFFFSLSNQWGGGGAGPLYPLDKRIDCGDMIDDRNDNHGGDDKMIVVDLFIYLFLIFIQGSPFTDRWSSMGP